MGSGADIPFRITQPDPLSNLNNEKPWGTSNFTCLIYGLVTFSVVLTSGYLWNPAVFQNRIEKPQKDDVFYDNLGFNLARGNGYFMDFTDPNWLSIYQDRANEETNAWIKSLAFRGHTTVRAPGFPAILAGMYRGFGHRWDFIYLLNGLVVCTGLTVLLIFICRRFGLIVGVIGTITISLDFGVMKMISQLMTEAIATGFACVTFCCLILAWERTRHRSMQFADDSVSVTPRFDWRDYLPWVLLGVLFGLFILIRSNLVVWLFLLSLFSVLWAGWLFSRGKNGKQFLLASVCVLLLAATVCTPWWIRNCNLIGQFAPFGTGGSIGWVGGYCDRALNNDGNWDLETVLKTQRESFEVYPIRGEPLPTQEYFMGKHSQAMGNAWAKQNWHLLPKLMSGKALNHLALINQPYPIVHVLNGLLLLGACIGCAVAWNRVGFWIALIVLCSLLTTMLTWSHFGRYMIPIRPLIHCASAIGTFYFWRWIICDWPLWKRGLVSSTIP